MSRQPGVLLYYIVESDKSFYEATLDLEPVVQRHGLAVLHVHDFGEILLGEGIDFDDECKLFEICNFRLLEKLLAGDMRLSAALPWRISVFTDGGATKIGLIRMAPMLAKNCGNTGLPGEIEATLIRIIDETR